MARGITENDVFIACDALVLGGERPTIERVRQKIGRGSPNTVSPMLDTWFKGLGRRLQDPGAFAPPTDVPHSVLQAAQHFWEVAQSETRREFDVRVSAGLADAEARVEAAMSDAARAESEGAGAAARLEKLEAELAQSRGVLEAERLNHRGTTTKLEGAMARFASLEEQIAQLQQTVLEERARADLAIAAANERGDGAERRAAMEIEGERVLRVRSEKMAEGLAKKFEAALRDQVRANEQANAAEDRLVALRSQAERRELELKDELRIQEGQIKKLESTLAGAIRSGERAAAQAEAIQATVRQLESAFVSSKPVRAASKRPPKS